MILLPLRPTVEEVVAVIRQHPAAAEAGEPWLTRINR